MTLDDTGRIVSLPDEYEPPRHWWQNPRWLGWLAVLIFAIGNAGWALTSLETSTTVHDQQKPLTTIEDTVTGPLSASNKKLDDIIAYINAQQAKADQSAAALARTLTEIDQIRVLICASSDPVTEFVCGTVPIPTVIAAAPSTSPAIPTAATTTTAPPVTPAAPTTTCATLPNGKCKH